MSRPSSLALFLLVSFSFVNSESTVVENFIECLTLYATPSISRNIYNRDNSSFSTILQNYNRNLRFLTPQTPKPILIITPTDITHAQATLSCAKPLGLQVRVRSGGHDYEGLSYSSLQSDLSFVLLDLFNFRYVDVCPECNYVGVGSGATVGELYHKIAESNSTLAIPAGVCPTLGIGGHFSGGGYGNLARKYGLSIDHIFRVFYIDANGRYHATDTVEEDVLWAITGGGAASFGIVISWDIELLPIPEKVTVFNVKMNIEQGAVDVAYRWQYVAPNLPKDLFIRATHEVVESSIIEGENTVEVSFMGLFLGTSTPLLSLMNNFKELGLKQIDCIETSWINSTLFWNDFPSGTSVDALLERPNNGSYFFKSKSDFVKKPITKEGISSIWKKMMELENVVMQWNPYGGRMSEISESATPFPHRAGNLFMIEYPLIWTEEGMDSTNYFLNKSKTFYDFMTPFVSDSPREAFFNYRDLDIGANLSNKTDYEVAEEYGRKYFKGNFDRLVRVKTKMDPDNFFRNEQSIPPLPKYEII